MAALPAEDVAGHQVAIEATYARGATVAGVCVADGYGGCGSWSSAVAWS